MRDFSRSAGRLRTLPFHARLAYSTFLAFTIAAFAVTILLLDDMVGVGFDRVGEYYAGESERAVERQPEPEGEAGPAIDLVEEHEVPPIAEPMPRRKLLEVTHFHLFSMPVYLLILSHLYMLSRARGWAKTTWIAIGTLGTALHVLAPWLATSGSPTSIAVYSSSGVALLVSYGVMGLVPLWEMWGPVPKQREEGTARGEPR